MKKILWKIGIVPLFALLLCGICSNNARAMSDIYDYDIEGYHVDVDVSEDNTLHVKEIIDVYFNQPRHGIVRDIPTEYTVFREDGSYTDCKVTVKVGDVTERNSVTYISGYKSIKIGNANRTITGPKTYEINYDILLPKDPLKGKDEFYYNVIGTEWDTQIANVSFTINMPKEFDASKLGATWGEFNHDNVTDINMEVNGNTITGSLVPERILQPREGLTVRSELPEGYFVPRKENNIFRIVRVAIPTICVVIAFLMWVVVGRDEKTVDVMEFTPPDDMNSLEIAFLYKGEVKSNDVISLLIYLANEGYLKITNVTSSGIFKTEKFMIEKLKEYDGNSEEERLFLDGLFSGGKSKVSQDELENSFYKTVNKIMSNINTKLNRETIFEKNSINKNWILVLMNIVIMLGLFGTMLIDENSSISPDMAFVMLFPIIGFSVMGLGLFQRRMPLSAKLFLIVWGMGFGGIPLIVLMTQMEGEIHLIDVLLIIWSVLCIIFICVFMRIMSKRNAYGRKMLGRIRGFKTFLEIAEKDRLSRLVNEDPSYFYNIIPYADVLGVYDKWMQQFEGLALEAPNWYDSPDHFHPAHFHHFMSQTITSANKVMNSSPSSSGSGGHSGGGHSGGGHGGGGGHSW